MTLSNLSQYGAAFQIKVLSSLLTHKEFLLNIHDVISEEYFDNQAHKWIIGENLRYLCPNCHSQTHTFRVKNYIKTSSRKWVEEEKIIESIKQGGSTADILRRVGLRAVGDNYNRVERIRIKWKL